ncbi:SDR family oxidoreductase [Rhizobium sp. LCM 4573]|uniref:SDR family NAD(P)-dependent oxidoreductase n=1 Tax=Rhizobium sp. LCM 4573 TaxID=1848291 RepID=UPI0008D907AA|nr:SDR family NAD(P)-dependent oxidoreductase [Rhizobium sp. LCM 4573]OHV84564.1 oxidoreductase [Rhizobium sp. LCM 4573]
MNTIRELAVVTGASSGIGFELAKLCVIEGYDIITVANEPEIHTAAEKLAAEGTRITAVEADLAEKSGVDKLMAAIDADSRPVELLFANAGSGLGEGFLDRDFKEIEHVLHTNITGTLDVLHRIGMQMRARGRGRILITGSIAGFVPGSFQAVYNASKAFLNNFSFALRNELKDSGVTVTCLMPGPTDTEFFERADIADTPLGEMKKDDPAFVARIGFDAMMEGEGDVVSGWKNKLQSVIANVTPSEMLAEQHRKMAEPDQHKPA